MTRTTDSAVRLTDLTLDLSRAMRQYMHKCIKDDKVNFLQIHALALVDEHSGVTMKQFAQHMKVTSPSATSFVERLVKLGWVRRVSSDENRKIIRLALTPAGKRMLTTKKKERALLMQQVIDLLPQEDQQRLERIFNHLIALLHQHS